RRVAGPAALSGATPGGRRPQLDDPPTAPAARHASAASQHLARPARVARRLRRGALCEAAAGRPAGGPARAGSRSRPRPGRRPAGRSPPGERPGGHRGVNLLGFQAPLVLLLLLLLPALAFGHHRRPRPALRVPRLPGRHAGSWRLHLPFYLRLAALALLILALARPRQGFTWEESTTQGIDIQIALDVSASMGAEDFQPDNRLQVAKSVVREFIAGRPADRIGLVLFAGSAVTLAPLTADRTMLDGLVDGVELHTLPDGTAVGVGLAT